MFWLMHEVKHTKQNTRLLCKSRHGQRLVSTLVLFFSMISINISSKRTEVSWILWACSLILPPSVYKCAFIGFSSALNAIPQSPILDKLSSLRAPSRIVNWLSGVNEARQKTSQPLLSKLQASLTPSLHSYILRWLLPSPTSTCRFCEGTPSEFMNVTRP